LIATGIAALLLSWRGNSSHFIWKWYLFHSSTNIFHKHFFSDKNLFYVQIFLF